MNEAQQEVNALKAELKHIQNPVQRQRLESLVQRLESRLNDSEEDSATSGEVLGVVEQFEAEHPRLTQVLNRIAVTLSDMGI